MLGVACLVGHLAISGQAPIPNVYNPLWISQHGHMYRFTYLYIALMGERLKYYFAWKVEECSIHIISLSFMNHLFDLNGIVLMLMLMLMLMWHSH